MCRLCCAVLLLAAALTGCTATRAPLATFEPDFAYTRSAAGMADAGDSLERFYPVPHGETKASASARRADRRLTPGESWAFPADLISTLGRRD